MGCDIHPHIEIKRGKKWVCLESKRDTRHDEREEPMEGLSSRNYTLFGVLAGVRDSRVKQIIPRRGVPEDASDKVKKEYEDERGDAHSASWILLKELLDFNWDKRAGRIEMRMTAVDYFAWKESKGLVLPEDQDSLYVLTNHESSYEVKTEEEMTLLLLSTPAEELSPVLRVKERPGYLKKKIGLRGGAFITVNAPVTYRYMIPHFVNVTLPALAKLGDPDKVRVVFWFDN